MAQSKISADWQTCFNEAQAAGTLPSHSRGIIGCGPAGFVLVLAMVADILCEREMVQHPYKKLPVIKRVVTVIEKQEELAAGAGGAYYKQDGALNSGFADILTLLDRDLLAEATPNVNYEPFLDLVGSLQTVARKWADDKIPNLLTQYAKQNQLGVNLLVAALKDGTLDTTKACFLRRTVSDIFFEMYKKVDAFVMEHVPELTLRFLFETAILSAEIVDGNRLRMRGTRNERYAPEGIYEFDSWVNTSGTPLAHLLPAEILPFAFHGPANAEGIRKHIADMGHLDNNGKVQPNTRFLIVGTLLHGLDQFGALTTVLGANKYDESRAEPWYADTDFAEKTGNTITMLSRSEANLAPPRLSHDIVLNGEQLLLTTADAHAFSLFHFDDFPVYRQVKEAVIAEQLGIHPGQLPSDATTDAQLTRFLNDIHKDDNGELTFTAIERTFALGREFGQYPSADPAEAEKDAQSEFPATIRTGQEWYNARHASITSPEYIATHSNAATMEAETHEYITFAAPPKSSMRNMGEHHESGLLKFTTGDIRKITRDPATNTFSLDGKTYDIVIAPGIISGKLDPVMQSLYPHLKTDIHGNVVYATGRQLMLKDGSLLPFFDYGNNSSGRRVTDAEGKQSISGRWTRDVATLFAKYLTMPVVSSMLCTGERLAVNGHPDPLAVVQEFLAATKPDEQKYRAEVATAAPRLQNARELELFLSLARTDTTFSEWLEAFSSAHDAESRNTLMTAWLKGSPTQKRLATAFFDGLKTLSPVEAKTRDEYAKQYIDPPVLESRLAMLETNYEFAK